MDGRGNWEGNSGDGADDVGLFRPIADHRDVWQRFAVKGCAAQMLALTRTQKTQSNVGGGSFSMHAFLPNAMSATLSA